VIGERMAGPGIRAWELGRALMSEHEVTLAAPSPLPESAPFPLIETRRSILRDAVPRFDVALVQGYSLFQYSSLQQARHLVVDLYDPFVLENLEVHASQPPMARRRIHDYDVSLLRQQLILGDFFLCASERQRHFWIGMLTATNRVNPLTYDSDRALHRLIEVVPFGLPAEPPRKTGGGLRDGTNITADDVVVLWGGGIWNWFDPLTLLRAMAQAVRRRSDLKLVFMGTKHPNPSIPQMQMTGRANQLADELQLTGRYVFFRPGWVPYLKRQNLLADADIGVSLHFEHVETAYSFRTRVLDYLWAGLPLVQLADQPLLRQTYRRRVLDVAKRFRWDVVAQPLNEYCRSPWHAADRKQRSRALMRERGGMLKESRVLAQKAWYSLRTEGPRSLAVRMYRFLRQRL